MSYNIFKSQNHNVPNITAANNQYLCFNSHSEDLYSDILLNSIADSSAYLELSIFILN